MKLPKIPDVRRYFEYFRDIEYTVRSIGLDTNDWRVRDMIVNAWSNGYHSCLADIKKPYTKLPQNIVNERMFLMGWYLAVGIGGLEAIARKYNTVE